MALSGLRVLVVEDEGLAAMLIEDMLEDFGCVVVGSAARLADAMVQAQTAKIDVATLDVNLAGQLSYPVADILQSRHIPFVFTTGYRSNALPLEWRDAVVLAKPCSKVQAANALRSATDHADRGLI